MGGYLTKYIKCSHNLQLNLSLLHSILSIVDLLSHILHSYYLPVLFDSLKSPLIMSAPVAIIGGGPSGLAFARLLQLNNIDFVVYERNAAGDEEAQGGSLDLHASTGQMVMKQADLTDEFEKHARREGSAAVLFDMSGNKLLDFGSETDAPEIDRVHLRRLLADSVMAEKIHWGKTVTALDRDDRGEVIVSFADGTTASGFKLVVGADGTWSRVRPLVRQPC